MLDSTKIIYPATGNPYPKEGPQGATATRQPDLQDDRSLQLLQGRFRRLEEQHGKLSAGRNEISLDIRQHPLHPTTGLKSRGGISLDLLGPRRSEESEHSSASSGTVSGRTDWTSNPAESDFFHWEALASSLDAMYGTVSLLTQKLNSVPALIGQGLVAATGLVPDILALIELRKQQAQSVDLQARAKRIQAHAREVSGQLADLTKDIAALEADLRQACETNHLSTQLNQPPTENEPPLVVLNRQIANLKAGMADMQDFARRLSEAANAEEISKLFGARLEEETRRHQKMLKTSAAGTSSLLVGSALNLTSFLPMVAGGLLAGGNALECIFAFYEAGVSYQETQEAYGVKKTLDGQLETDLARANEDQRILRNVAKMAKRQISWKQSLIKSLAFFFNGISGLTSTAYFLGYFVSALAKVGLALSLAAAGSTILSVAMVLSFICYKIRGSRAQSREIKDLREAVKGKQTSLFQQFRDRASIRLENKLAMRFLVEKEALFQAPSERSYSATETETDAGRLCDLLGLKAKGAVLRDISSVLARQPNGGSTLTDKLLEVFDRYANKQYRDQSLLAEHPEWRTEAEGYLGHTSLQQWLAAETGLKEAELNTLPPGRSSWSQLVQRSLDDRARLMAADKLIKRDPDFALHAMLDQLRKGNVATEDLLRTVWQVPDADIEICRMAITRQQCSSAVGLLAMHMGILRTF